MHSYRIQNQIKFNTISLSTRFTAIRSLLCNATIQYHIKLKKKNTKQPYFIPDNMQLLIESEVKKIQKIIFSLYVNRKDYVDEEKPKERPLLDIILPAIEFLNYIEEYATPHK